MIKTVLSVDGMACSICEAHVNDAIRKAAGDCVMPREGIFVKVITSGKVNTGDEIEIIK